MILNMVSDDDDPRAPYKVYEGGELKGTYATRAEARRAQQQLHRSAIGPDNPRVDVTMVLDEGSVKELGLTGPDIEPMKFKIRPEAHDWCKTHHPGSPINEIGSGRQTPGAQETGGDPRR